MKANLDLINARKNEKEASIQRAIFIEKLEQEGLTPDDIKSEAKQLLGLTENDSVLLEYEAKMAEINKGIFAFVQTTNQVAYLERAEVLSKENIDSIKTSIKALSEKIAGFLEVEVEDLYEEIDEDFYKKGDSYEQ